MPRRNHMGSDRSRQNWWERMRPLIPQSGSDDDTWITGRDLEAKADVTEHQRSAGINWGRANDCPDKDWALVSGKRGYRWVQTTRQVAAFMIPRTKSAGTLIRIGHLGAWKPIINHLLKTGQITPFQAQSLEKSVRRAHEDIEAHGTAI